jgi:hypothetical protein
VPIKIPIVDPGPVLESAAVLGVLVGGVVAVVLVLVDDFGVVDVVAGVAAVALLVVVAALEALVDFFLVVWLWVVFLAVFVFLS